VNNVTEPQTPEHGEDGQTRLIYRLKPTILTQLFTVLNSFHTFLHPVDGPLPKAQGRLIDINLS